MRDMDMTEGHFYPRPPRGGRLHLPHLLMWHLHFYPRPPRGGRRTATRCKEGRMIFLSTPSARRATSRQRRGECLRHISIHALREEGDAKFVCSECAWTDFYPRPPRGGRQKTPRLWYTRGDISIHALREEGDIASPASRRRMCRFLSTPSARRATLHSGCTGCPG